MEKKPEVDGAYFEVEAADLISNGEQACNSTVLVITNPRLELAGEDKERFTSKFDATLEELADETKDMDDRQKAFYVIRHMLLF